MEERYQEEYMEIDLRELLYTLWKGKFLIIALFLVAVVGAFFITEYYITPVYQTETTVQLSNIEGIYSQSSSVKQIFKNSQEIRPILNKNSEKEITQAELVNYLNNNVTITVLNSGGEEKISQAELIKYLEDKEEINDLEYAKILNIKVKYHNPRAAVAIAEGMINSYKKKAEKFYSDFISQKRGELRTVAAEIKKLEARINKTEQQLQGLENSDMNPFQKHILLNSNINHLNNMVKQKRNLINEKQSLERDLVRYHSIEILNPPYLPENPVSPNLKLNLAIAGVLALMLGVFLVFLREFLKDTNWKEFEDK